MRLVWNNIQGRGGGGVIIIRFPAIRRRTEITAIKMDQGYRCCRGHWISSKRIEQWCTELTCNGVVYPQIRNWTPNRPSWTLLVQTNVIKTGTILPVNPYQLYCIRTPRYVLEYSCPVSVVWQPNTFHYCLAFILLYPATLFQSQGVDPLTHSAPWCVNVNGL